MSFWLETAIPYEAIIEVIDYVAEHKEVNEIIMENDGSYTIIYVLHL